MSSCSFPLSQATQYLGSVVMYRRRFLSAVLTGCSLWVRVEAQLTAAALAAVPAPLGQATLRHVPWAHAASTHQVPATFC
jgi:hypothetical protein